MNAAQLLTHSQNSASLCGCRVSASAFSLLRLKKRVFACPTSITSRKAA
jgi:hypothetical protein